MSQFSAACPAGYYISGLNVAVSAAQAGSLQVLAGGEYGVWYSYQFGAVPSISGWALGVVSLLVRPFGSEGSAESEVVIPTGYSGSGAQGGPGW